MTAAVTMRLQPRRDAPARARATVRRLSAHLPEEARDGAELLTSELVTNALVHGSGVVTVAVEVDGDAIAVAVADESPDEPRPEQVDVAAERGRGLHLVRALATAWGVSRVRQGDGKVVWFKIA